MGSLKLERRVITGHMLEKDEEIVVKADNPGYLVKNGMTGPWIQA